MLRKAYIKKIKILSAELALTAFVLLVAFFVSKATYGAYLKYKYASYEESKQEKIHNDMQENLNKAKNNYDFMSTEFGKEYKLRAELGYAKEGEKVIVLLREDEPKILPKEQSWLQSLINFFTN